MDINSLQRTYNIGLYANHHFNYAQHEDMDTVRGTLLQDILHLGGNKGDLPVQFVQLVD